ncbi:hypothetical protein OG21DRAFT_1519747 [Imleria badia]|nr:hypothetical protein OG21DRAFT_1519747 [Imleria badia]
MLLVDWATSFHHERLFSSPAVCPLVMDSSFGNVNVLVCEDTRNETTAIRGQGQKGLARDHVEIGAENVSVTNLGTRARNSETGYMNSKNTSDMDGGMSVIGDVACICQRSTNTSQDNDGPCIGNRRRFATRRRSTWESARGQVSYEADGVKGEQVSKVEDGVRHRDDGVLGDDNARTRLRYGRDDEFSNVLAGLLSFLNDWDGGKGGTRKWASFSKSRSG